MAVRLSCAGRHSNPAKTKAGYGAKNAAATPAVAPIPAANPKAFSAFFLFSNTFTTQTAPTATAQNSPKDANGQEVIYVAANTAAAHGGTAAASVENVLRVLTDAAQATVPAQHKIKTAVAAPASGKSRQNDTVAPTAAKALKKTRIPVPVIVDTFIKNQKRVLF